MLFKLNFVLNVEYLFCNWFVMSKKKYCLKKVQKRTKRNVQYCQFTYLLGLFYVTHVTSNILKHKRVNYCVDSMQTRKSIWAIFHVPAFHLCVRVQSWSINCTWTLLRGKCYDIFGQKKVGQIILLEECQKYLESTHNRSNALGAKKSKNVGSLLFKKEINSLHPQKKNFISI